MNGRLLITIATEDGACLFRGYVKGDQVGLRRCLNEPTAASVTITAEDMLADLRTRDVAGIAPDYADSAE